MKRKKINYQLLLRRVCLIVLDIFLIILSSLMALATRFEFDVRQIPEEFFSVLLDYGVLMIFVTLIVFGVFRIYSSLWEYAGLEETFKIIGAVVFSSLCDMAIVVGMGKHLPRSYYVIRTFYLIALVGGSRFFYRLIRLRYRKRQHYSIKKKKKIMLIGAGEAGRTLIQEIQNSRYLDQKICCVIDDNRRKIGRYILGIRVVGDRNAIKRSVEHYGIEQIIIAIPSAGSRKIRPILEICKDTGCELKILPGVYQLVNGEVNVSKLRPVNIEDLLGREEINVNIDEIMDYVCSKTILVTGGGGSIGSELCRQIAAHKPERLIIFDIYENNAYDIQQELKMKYPNLKLTVLIGSIRDEERVDTVLGKYRPDIIYHAAAHKHVPLMEASPNEAIKNNVLGTYNLVLAADRWKVKKFVQISTDKAVNPTNIMGASKRVCEMIIQSFNRHSKTDFVAVRFGNVLGSNGSVIPLFKKQIAAGGPVTVTDPEIIRYFMTISEAVSLVLQAGVYARGGEIFVLDIGEPVKILDLAKNMIRLSGYIPEKDIAIEFTGLRPGEKLYEELLMDEEGMTETPNKLIHIGHPIDVDEDRLYYALRVMKEAAANETDDMRLLMQSIVSTYHIKTEENQQYKIHLYVLGIGPLKNEMQEYIWDNEFENIVTLLGYKVNPYKYIKNCDLFVCASFAEGFSTAVTEALIVGTPVCTVDVSGMKELLGENNEYGIITENNEEALFREIRQLLCDDKLLAYYREKAKIRGNMFETQKTVKAVENFLINL